MPTFLTNLIQAECEQFKKNYPGVPLPVPSLLSNKESDIVSR